MTREISMAGGLVALVDDKDEELVRQHKWRGKRDKHTIYARAHIRGPRPRKTVLMHNLIMPTPEGMQMDHANGNGLDNRRENLRLATHSQNSANADKQRTYNGRVPSSSFKGVYWHRWNKRWGAKISPKGKQIYLGYFRVEEDAAQTYNDAALVHFGKFARLNVL